MSFINLLQDGPVDAGRRQGRPNDLAFKISGNESPAIDVEVQPGQGLVCEPASVIMCDPAFEFRSGTCPAGQMVFNTSMDSSARLRLSTGCMGTAGAFELASHGGRLLSPVSSVVALGPGVEASAYAHFTGIAAAASDADLAITMLAGDGWAFLRALGDAGEVCLCPGQVMRVQAAHIAVLSATVDIDDVHDGTGEGFVDLTGPGTVWLQHGRLSMPVVPAPEKTPVAATVRPNIRPGALARVLNGAA